MGIMLSIRINLDGGGVAWRMAYLKPVRMAPPTPRLKGSLRTDAPACSAMEAVSSWDPSSTTRMSCWGTTRRTSRTVSPIASASFQAGMMMSVPDRVLLLMICNYSKGHGAHRAGLNVPQSCNLHNCTVDNPQ
ncbi:hypothetical protein AHiyo6_19700 [Arthrobacter sp. Hiyo6]|nr:hypothetical protein AHiyo6_19700 [Arthrobacter sp. Hiyo6]